MYTGRQHLSRKSVSIFKSEMRNHSKSLVDYFISVPSLLRNNAAMSLPSLIDVVSMYGRAK